MIDSTMWMWWIYVYYCAHGKECVQKYKVEINVLFPLNITYYVACRGILFRLCVANLNVKSIKKNVKRNQLKIQKKGNMEIE